MPTQSQLIVLVVHHRQQAQQPVKEVHGSLQTPDRWRWNVMLGHLSRVPVLRASWSCPLLQPVRPNIHQKCMFSTLPGSTVLSSAASSTPPDLGIRHITNAGRLPISTSHVNASSTSRTSRVHNQDSKHTSRYKASLLFRTVPS